MKPKSFLLANLLAASTAYCETSGMSEARLSTIVYGAGDRIPRLRKGKDMLSGNVEAGLQWLSDHWPDLGETWPLNVPRPAPSPGSAASYRSAETSIAA